MFFLDHRIAGITFRTESDVEITPLWSDSFQKFQVDSTKFDVLYRVLGIEQDSLILPPLGAKELELVSRCAAPPYLGPGTLTLPPLILGEEPITYRTPLNKDEMHIPLLGSPLVRSRLEKTLSHPEQVSLALHIYSVVIHDYAHNRVDIFYPSFRRELFEGNWVENGFRRLFASMLPAFSGVMLHSSGIIRNHRVALFLAPDEGGKTTVIKNAADGVVLCDDWNILRQEEDAVFVNGTPWGTVTNASKKAQLGGLFLLEKASNFELIPIDPRDILQFLWDEHMPFWNILPKNLRTQAFDILCDACYNTPTYRMCFPKDFIDWDAIDAAMDRSKRVIA
jgi:hypothetical protein